MEKTEVRRMGAIDSLAAVIVLVGSSIGAKRGVPPWDRTIFVKVNTVFHALAPMARGPHWSWEIGGTSLAFTVGVSRVHVGAHYPLDVGGGWAFGATIADGYRRAESLLND